MGMVMDISVTFTSGPTALVRIKEPGKHPEFRKLPLAGTAAESALEIEAIILEHLGHGPSQWQGWLWEA
jgi:hypothetical protein